MASEIDETSPEWQEFLAWKAANPDATTNVHNVDVDLEKPQTDTDVLRAAREETTGPVESNSATAAPATVEETAVPADVTVSESEEKPLTDTEARRESEDADTQGQTEDAGAVAPVAPATTDDTPKAVEPFDEKSYEFEVAELVKRDGPVPGTKTYGLVVKRSPMPSPTPDGKVLPGYVVASLGLTNEVLSTSQDLGLEKL